MSDEALAGARAEALAGATAETPKRSRFGRRRRANVTGGRRHSHRVLVTPEEEARLLQLAEAARVTVPRLLIESALATGAGSAVTPTARRDAMAELFAVRRLLAAVSNNVNQIARHANAGEQFPPDARAALTALRRVVLRVDEAIDGLSGV